MRLLPFLLASALAWADAPRPLDVVLKIDAPASVSPAFKPPFRVEVAFVMENPSPARKNGLLTFSGQCPWEEPGRALTHRWKGGLVLDPAPQGKGRTVRGIRYLIRDREGRTVVAFPGKDAPGRIHAEALSGLVLHLTVGNLGEPGGAIQHQLELEW